ncbi:MAG: hypothetical protein DRJ26_02480 [Candidatus Methanomethylicota archaeon]|uniref:Uncharacterized protein n=1 Tax=Thermoproteota archaeon TaxID=2056631 RepID=A0A497F3G4_9CREN|nr:MAG: hypothetical protein DRJ26_02480 [Candidatus Verstraetearchaeota archaeon]
MAWGWGRGRRGWIGPWPGRGPFSHLPPWMRPGWLFGRGSCWWLFGAPWYYQNIGYGYPWMRWPMYYPYMSARPFWMPMMGYMMPPKLWPYQMYGW